MTDLVNILKFVLQIFICFAKVLSHFVLSWLQYSSREKCLKFFDDGEKTKKHLSREEYCILKFMVLKTAPKHADSEYKWFDTGIFAPC